MLRTFALRAVSGARPGLTRSMTIVPGNTPGPVTNPDEEPRFLEMVKMYFDRASAHTAIDKGLLEVIKGCNAVLRVSFPIKRDDGSVEVRAAAPSAARGSPRFMQRRAHACPLPVLVYAACR